MHKYEHVVDDIIGRITRGDLSTGDRLPTIVELAEHYDVSTITVKRAMDELDARGLIARRRGSGTYVKGAPEAGSDGGWSAAGQMKGFFTEHSAAGETVSSLVKVFNVVVPPVEVAEALTMGLEDFAYHVLRVRLANGVPRAIDDTYMPINLIPGLTRSDAENSVYRYIGEKLGLNIGSANRRVKAVAASAEQAAWLNLAEGAPLLSITQTGYLDDGTPFERSCSLHVPGYELLVVSRQ